MPNVRSAVVRPALKPKVQVRIRQISIPGERERAIKILSPTKVSWDQWETLLNGRHLQWDETENWDLGSVIRLDPSVSGRIQVRGTMDQRPVTRDSNPVLLRGATEPPMTAPRRRPATPKLYGVYAKVEPGDELVTARLTPRAGATPPPAGSWYHVFWAGQAKPRPADYRDIGGAAMSSVGAAVTIPIRGDRGSYYVRVVGPSGSGFVSNKSNLMRVPSVPEPIQPMKVAGSDRRFFGVAG